MNLRTLATLLLLVVLGVAATPAAAADHLLGVTHLTRIENDTDLLVFKKCRRNLHALQVRAFRGQVEIERLWVRYGNGGRDELELRERLAQGSHSRWIDLRGGERCVKAIGVIGDTELSADQARVELWGR